MAVEHLEVSTPDGACPVVVVTPGGSGPWPAVLLLMDAGGVRQVLVEMAERISADGYVVVLPELYHRHGAYEPFDVTTAFDDPDERARLLGMARSLTGEQAMTTVGAVLDWLDTRPDVRSPRVGTTGYCMGGRVSLQAAGTFPDRIAAAASFHGGNLAAEDDPASPSLLAPSIRARVLVAVAKEDGSFPLEQEDRLTAAFTAAGTDARVEHYDARHGFAVPDNPTYDPAAAERHDAALRDLLAASLP